ncbi:MAG TPA: hypothetical protein VNW52_06535 [Burkholderiaceae bacterium]|jgi:hypothetical protein|nr:hypothetical protein [Burkholderiaceae bacterium]
MAVELSVRSNVKELQKSLSAYCKQIPFATAVALTATAKLVQATEVDDMKRTFKNPSPFTLKSVRLIPALKSNPVATVFVMDKAADYLAPYEDGGLHKLSSRALLNPKDIRLNQYGQLPRNTLAMLKARPDIVIGPIKTRNGIVNGVWQRVTDTKKVTLLNAKGKRLRGLNKLARDTSGKQTSRLKLLIRFGNALPVTQHLGYKDRAKVVIATSFAPEFKKALAQATASAK